MRDDEMRLKYTSPDMRKNTCIAAVVLLIVAAASAESPVIKLQDAVDAALAAGDDLKVATGNLDAAQAQRDLARSKAGISLSASGSYSLTDGFGSDLSQVDPVKKTSTPTASALSRLVGSADATHSIQGGLALSAGNASAANPFSKLSLTATETLPPSPSAATTALGVSLAQTLWDGYPGGQTKASVAKADLAFKGKDLAAAQARSTVAVSAKKAFVTMLTAQRTLALRAGVLDKQAALLKQIQATYALQQASAIDLMNAQINERTAELDLETSRHDLSLARQRLANIMGMPADSDFSVAEIEEPLLPAASVEEAIKVALAKRTDAALIDLNTRSSSIDLTLAKALSQPGLSATAGITMGIVGGSAPGTAGSASLGLKLSLPILDSGAAKDQSAAAEAQLAVYRAQAALLADAIAADVRDAYWSATILMDRIGLAKQVQQMNDNQLELVKTQFQFGTATNQDLLTAQVNSANAGAAYLAAKGAYLLQELTLETAMGQ
jgi:outer membrane protein